MGTAAMTSQTNAAGAGRVVWRRYALVTLPAMGIAGTMLALTAQGALAASFAVSGTAFKLSASSLDGTGFVSYGTVNTSANGTNLSANQAGFTTAELHGLCQSVVSDTPFGTMTMRLTAGGDDPVKATNMVADYDRLGGDITFTDYASGVDASQVSGGPSVGEKGEWSQQSKKIHIDGLRQNTWATTAGTFVLKGLNIEVSFGEHECY
jgi:hypothetical protein